MSHSMSWLESQHTSVCLRVRTRTREVIESSFGRANQMTLDEGAARNLAASFLGTEPEEIGELVLFMCSDACEFMTADTVYVNGGGGWR